MPDITPPEVADATRKRFRLILNLGKYRVMERENDLIKIALGGSTTMTVGLPSMADVKAGDLLTLYTEIFYKDPPNANPEPTSIQ